MAAQVIQAFLVMNKFILVTTGNVQRQSYLEVISLTCIFKG